MATTRRLPLTTRLASTSRLIAAATICSIAALVVLASPAHAQDGYKYWGYYQDDNGAWAFAQSGPSEVTPRDGALEGWRFASTPTDDERPPRAGDIAFDDVCDGTEAGDGEKRIAILIDYGTDEDAPDGDEPAEPVGECAVVAEDATSEQALQAVADVRLEDGLTCGINGYPSTTCSEPVADAAAPEQEENVDFALPGSADDDTDASASNDDSAAGDADDDGVPWALIAIAALVVVLAVGAFMLTRRRA